MIQWHIGCSSYYNRLWRGVFYPEDLPSGKWFEYYCSHFNTFEINSTFYTFPTLPKLKTWYGKAPGKFTFSVKAPKLITHVKKMEQCGEELDRFYNLCHEALNDKLGCLLFQFPPSFSYTEERLQKILKALGGRHKTAVEFRHLSWWDLRVRTMLRDNDIIFCSVDYPGLPNEIIPAYPSLYLRLHGTPKLFYAEYDFDSLQNTFSEIEKFDTLQDVYVYFNNTAATGGIINALTLKALEIKDAQLI